MTRMADHDDHEPDTYDEEVSRSIFSALWFRALVVVLVLGVVAAVAVPYVLDVMMPPAPKPAVAMKPPASPPPAPAQLPQPAAPVQQVTTPGPAPAVPPTPAMPPVAAKPAESPEPVKTEAPKQETPTAEPRAAAAKPESPRPAATKPTEVAKALEPTKAAESSKVIEAHKPSEPKNVAAVPPTARQAPATRAAASATSSAPYWVQVGAFKDEGAAKRLADKLREQNFTVEHSVRAAGAPAPASAGGGDRYNVFVSGLAPAELNTKLSAKGLKAQPVAGGVMVTPSMPLREAVALSKDLANEGLKIQVRRVAASGGGASPSASPAGGGESLHRVRVGGFGDRAAAEAAARELEAKGYKVFVARGNQ